MRRKEFGHLRYRNVVISSGYNTGSGDASCVQLNAVVYLHNSMPTSCFEIGVLVSSGRKLNASKPGNGY